MNVRKGVAAATLTLALVGLAGCSSDGGDGASSSTAADDAAASSTAGPEGALPEADLSGIPDPVASVNGEDVSKDDFAAYYESQFATASAQAQMSGEELDVEALQADTLDTIVDSVLLAQAADEGGYAPSDEEVEGLLEELATSNGLASTEEFLALLEEQGMDEQTAREEAGKQLAIEAYLDSEAGVEDPTDEEVRAYYDELVAQQEEAAGGEDGGATAAPGSELPAFEDVEEPIAEQLRSEDLTAATEELLAQLRSDAEVESYL